MSFLTAPVQKYKGWILGKQDWEQVVAHWTSNIVNPPLVGILTSIVFIIYTVPNPRWIWWWLAWALSLISLPPLSYVLWLVRKGELADIHMPDRQSRLKPLGLMLIWGVSCLFLFHYWGAPAILIFIILTALGYMAAMSTITLWWKISFHSSAITAAASIGLVTSGFSSWSIIAILLVPLVGWARVYLRQHTWGQVITGGMVGLSMGLLLLI